MHRIARLILAALAALMLYAAFIRTPAFSANFSANSAPVASTAPGAAEEHGASPSNPFDLLYIFILAGFVGFEVIGRVSPTLHTPLMSATNAISGISLVGSIVAAGAQYSFVSSILGCIAVAAATTNVVGGFMITDRMLKMFKRKEKAHP